MKKKIPSLVLSLAVLVIFSWSRPALSDVFIQCPTDNWEAEQAAGEDLDADGVVDYQDDNVVCIHLTGGDGFTTMADGYPQYMFGFGDVTGMPAGMVMMHGMLAANSPAPLIAVKEGNEVYLNLTNVGMMVRPDLFDPHTVHWHGFPNASAVFDGVPDASISINMGSTLTYYYVAPEPGTYIYHCHVEATEHMQMGMLGNLYVTPAQDGAPIGGFTQFAYNDGDGSTGYDVDYVLQFIDFDKQFHDASYYVQPLPFALMEDDYHMINGRGYPDTVNPNPIDGTDPEGGVYPGSQNVSSLIEAQVGDTILLRMSSLSVTKFHTITTLGIPMRVVGQNARLLRGPTGLDLSYYTNSVTLGGGESIDVILDTDGLAPGTYFLYSRNLDDLNNDAMDRGGAMTEIRLTSAP
ncbi:MAG: multicopper oxidase family protein [Candidatus Abyssobacteria bacterium SURF_5]|uniref:Multicopper oxidase family protein n=1 Tax=Abyssobacteria bacterium (strain SURF_5) TaxID=2093360 RepID=A0A3A4NR69_ABYX5|nr:MAG: multicopper oxidase family protein [Candidatus Abyssubacteria bacterium SURF_5]